MIHSEFVAPKIDDPLVKGKFSWSAPSNIALVKYWGKREPQIPENPSISFTLDACKTTTTLEFELKEQRDNDYDVQVFFEGEKKDDFKPKILGFFKRIEPYLNFLKDYKYVVKSSNSFPHSSGIASSASSMAALSLCLMSLERVLNPNLDDELFFKKASFLARLGSGSACRSIEGDLIVWGTHDEIPDSNDLFGIKYPFQVHENFYDYHDTILLVDKGEKQVSSSAGHALMHDHPFAQNRFKQAHSNLNELIGIFDEGDLKAFNKLIELEALTLHAMMMTSSPSYILMKPNTLEIINRVWDYRKQTGNHLGFTLDAGANVHLLYPANEAQDIYEFIKRELVVYCQNGHYICDRIGFGAKQLPV